MLQAYLAGDQLVRSWFGGNWDSIEALSSWTPNNYSWRRAQLHTMLKDNCDRYQYSKHSIAHIKALKNDDAYVIISGQQPAVGGGPLYTLIKVAQSVAQARCLREHGQKVYPLFWCASEDHDEGECNHADFITRDGALHRYSQAFEHTGASIHFQSAAAWWSGLVAQCQELFGNALGTDFILASKPNADESTSAWLCRFLAQLFKDDGLICVEAHDLRPLWHEYTDKFIQHWPRLALAKRRSEIMDAGFADSFNGLLQHAPLFLDEKTGRSALDLIDERAAQNIRKNLGIDSNNLSTGAGLRPIVQQLVLPGLAFVGGPGELQYHAFLGPLYDEYLAPMPRFIPRTQVSLLPNWLQRYLQAWSLEAEDIHAQSEAPLITDQKSTIDKQLQAIGDIISDIRGLPETNDDFQRRRDQGTQQLEKALQRMQQSLSRGRRNQRKLPAFGHIKDFLFPRGQRHERVMSLTQAVWLYGPGIARALTEYCMQATPGEHSFLRL